MPYPIKTVTVITLGFQKIRTRTSTGKQKRTHSEFSSNEIIGFIDVEYSKNVSKKIPFAAKSSMELGRLWIKLINVCINPTIMTYLCFQNIFRKLPLNHATDIQALPL